MTFQEKFDELKAKYGAIDESKLSEPFAVQINMTEDESQGTFYAAYMNGVFSIEPYDYHDHTAMITLPVATLEKILSGKADPVALYLAGKIAVEGDRDHALDLVKMMKKKAPARAKKAEKKAASEKKAPAEEKAPLKKKADAKQEAPAKEEAPAKPKRTRAKKSAE